MRTLLLLLSFSCCFIFSGQSQDLRVTPLNEQITTFENATNSNLIRQNQNLTKAEAIATNYQYEMKNVATSGQSYRGVDACLSFAGGPYIDFQTPPCDMTCGTPLTGGFEVWENEAYLLDGVAGSEYTFEFCNGYAAASWSAIITVGIYDGAGAAVPASDFAVAAGCSITFTVPADNTYIIVLSGDGNCGGAENQTDNGIPTLDCGPNGATCGVITTACEAGTLVNTDSVGVCPGGTITLTTNGDDAVPTGGDFRIQGIAGPDGTGANSTGPGTGFSIGATSSFTLDAGANGILAANSFPDMAGTWIFTFFVEDDTGNPCSVSVDSKIGNFLPTGAVGCASFCAGVSIVPTIVTTDESADSANDGTIDLSVAGTTGPYTYLWSNGATTEDLSGLTPGTYTVEITDTSGCAVNASATIEEWVDLCAVFPMSLNISMVDESVAGADDGAIDLVVTGGVAPFTYNWSNGSTTEDLESLADGTYVVTVTDANNCIVNAAYPVLPGVISGILDIDHLEDLNVYPVPSQGLVTVDLTLSKVSDVVLEIFDVNGKQLQSIALGMIRNITNDIDLSGYDSGMYLIKVNVADQSTVINVPLIK